MGKRFAGMVAVAAVVGLAVVAGVVGGVRPAAAHAELTSTTPSDGEQVETAPDSVSLTFTEDVSAGLGAVRVLDASGDRVDRGDVRSEGRNISVGLDELDDGPYIVAWRVVSADSHPIHGSFTFVVGDGDRRIDSELARSLLGGGDDGPWKLVGTLLRFLGYGGALLAVGLAVFRAYVHDRGAEGPTLGRLVRIGAAVGAIGIVFELSMRAALATGLGPDSVVEDGVLGQLLGDRVGVTMAATLFALLFVAVDGGRDRMLAAAAVVAVAVGAALSGHTATTSPAFLAQASDATHVAAASVWLGGVVGCLVVVLSRRRHGGSPAAVVVRFSALASFALVAVAVAGAALGWSEVRSMRALGTTAYGQLLLVKVALVALVALIGAWNRYRIVPVLEADLARDEVEPDRRQAPDAPDEPNGTDGTAPGGTARLSPPVGRQLRGTLGAEAALMVVVLLVTAFLVDVTPARSAVAAPFTGTTSLGAGTVEIDVDPTRAGPTTIHLYAYDETGQPRDLGPIELRFSLPAAGVTDLARTPDPTGPGHWTYQGDDLSVGGLWTIEVLARPTIFDEETASFEVRIQP